MSKIEDARFILEQLNLPVQQQSALCCLTLLSLANISEENSWCDAEGKWMRIHDVIAFSNSNYGTTYAENSRDTFRKQAMHHFRTAAIIEDNGSAVNSPKYRYRLTDEVLDLIKSYASGDWLTKLNQFKVNYVSLRDKYSLKRSINKISIIVNEHNLSFSSGKHNELQKAIIEEFVPRFAPGSECLYIGDTAEKDIFRNDQKLTELKFEIAVHNKMPNIVLYLEERKWLYFIEAVTSVGPMSPKRVLEIKEMTSHIGLGKVFVTAFLDWKTYQRFFSELAWETEVWIASEPDHMIHLNGTRFLGPY